jgi:predicted esterase
VGSAGSVSLIALPQSDWCMVVPMRSAENAMALLGLVRKKAMRRFLTGYLFVLALVALGLAQTGAKPQKRTLSFGSEDRTYSLFTPSGLATPAPVLLLLHGSHNDGMSLINLWQELGQSEGIILVAPDSADPAVWDYSKDSPDFLHAVLTEVESKYSVDSRRVYLFGQSTGGAYALYLSIVESEYFAATAIHDGCLPEQSFELIDSAKRRIPISMWAGTDNLSCPFSQMTATRDAFNARGFTLELHKIFETDQKYDAVADEVNGWAWQFLETNKLGKDADFQALAQLLYPLSKSKAQSQSNLSDVELTPQTLDRALWASAKPYLDDPLPQLIIHIRELRGLNPAPDQQLLPDLLKKTSDKSLELLKKMPNVISHESVLTTLEPRGPTWHEQFEYLVLRHEAKGDVTLEEYRTDKGKTSAAPLSQGTANAWVLFHPGNLIESRFRYLGRQKMDGRSTLVLAFAQIPDKVKFPGQVNFQGTSIPVLFQGIAWIDESEFRIVRLREDLLAPRPDISLQTLTSEVLFSAVRLPEAMDSLWLPHEAKIVWNFKGQAVQQLHQYSGFHLYRSKAKIVM